MALKDLDGRTQVALRRAALSYSSFVGDPDNLPRLNDIRTVEAAAIEISKFIRGQIPTLSGDPAAMAKRVQNTIKAALRKKK